MESWSLKVAGGFLAALLVTGSGFQLLGTPKPGAAGTGSEQRRARSLSGAAAELQSHAQHTPDYTKQLCDAGYQWYLLTNRCCQQCPAGQFMKAPCTSDVGNTTCERCPHGTYLAAPNLERKCRKCSECHAPAFQIVVQNCTETSDAKCGCSPGHFRQCTASACRDFTCQECRRCHGKDTLQNCSMKEDTQCGECQPGFYLEGSECRACVTQLAEKCIDRCGRACDGSSPGFGLEYVLLGLMGPLFLGALFIYHRRRTLSAGSPAAGGAAVNSLVLQQVSACLSGAAEKPPEVQGLHQIQVMEASQMSGNACPAKPPCSRDGWESSTAPQETASPLLGTLQQGSTLYTIINAVPVRRWKELMRVLELPDTEIEVVEMEFAHIRDQQYEMLKRWCQQKNTTLDPVFSALERMELAGCAEELRQQLQRCP